MIMDGIHSKHYFGQHVITASGLPVCIDLLGNLASACACSFLANSQVCKQAFSCHIPLLGRYGVSRRLFEDFLRPLLLVGLFAPAEELSAAVMIGTLYFYGMPPLVAHLLTSHNNMYRHCHLSCASPTAGFSATFQQYYWMFDIA